MLQSQKLQALKQRRDQAKADECLAQLSSAANGHQNLMPLVIEAVESYCTLGEIADALRKVFGEYK